MTKLSLQEAATRQQGYVVHHRQLLHAHPELRWEEDWTLAHIRCEIMRLAEKTLLEVATVQERGGLIVDVTVNPDMPRILLRADVDGLPVREATGLPFAAENGNMHACGHDMHSAMLLGTFRTIMLGQVLPTVNLRFVWQRAEENPVTTSGGDMLVNEENVCDGVERAYGLHVWATGREGLFQSRPGALLGNSGRLGMKIKCSGGHVAQPHLGTSAIRVGHAVMEALDRFNATGLPPHEPRTLEPAIFQSGTASNIMPGDATIWYGVRTMLAREGHAMHMGRIENVVCGVVAGFKGASVEFERALGHPALLNTPGEVARLADMLREAGEEYAEHPPILGGEDFAHYLCAKSGAFFMLGAGGPDAADHHSPTFNPSEAMLWRGVHYWLLLATTPLE